MSNMYCHYVDMFALCTHINYVYYIDHLLLKIEYVSHYIILQQLVSNSRSETQPRLCIVHVSPRLLEKRHHKKSLTNANAEFCLNVASFP